MECPDAINTIQQQFLCCYPVNCINWKILVDLTWDDQAALLDKTFNSNLNKYHPISTNYQLTFLKSLISCLEETTNEVHDDIYSAFCRLQAHDSGETKFYKHYLLPQFQSVVTLKESRSFVANGTTGLCTWQASVALSDWVLHHTDIVRNKRVIELGSGTGLCSIIILKCCQPRHVTMTDGSDAVIEILHENTKLNFETPAGTFSILHLPWDSCDVVQEKIYDVIIAADVVYDTTECHSLVYAIDHLFTLMEDKMQMILAATVRNTSTLEVFESLLRSRGFTIELQEVISTKKSLLHWDRTTPMRIMRITRM